MKLFKLKDLYFVKPNHMLFNEIKPSTATDLDTMEEGAKLKTVKEIFSSFDFVNIDSLYWEFNDVEKKAELKGKCTQEESAKIEIIYKDTLKLLCSCIGYTMFKSINITS